MMFDRDDLITAAVSRAVRADNDRIEAACEQALILGYGVTARYERGLLVAASPDLTVTPGTIESHST